MKITNKQHITLHQEAQEVLAQAERAGWEHAQVFTQGIGEDQPNYYRWPMIALSVGRWAEEYLSIGISTNPGYVTQSIYRYAEVHYNHPILTPGAVRQLMALIEDSEDALIRAGLEVVR
jgi:hypothetical protein